MATGAGKKNARVESERARLYQARQQFHAGTVKRRTRDNIVAGIGGGALILAILGGQWAYFEAGPGAPVPTPTPSPTDSASPTPDVSPSPTPEPTDATTPEPAPTD